MGLGFAASVADALTIGRALAESLMTDTCIITRAGVGKGAWKPETGQYDDPPRITIYEGVCRIQVTSIIANSKATGGGERVGLVQGAEFQLPVAGTDDVAVGDVAEMLTAAFDPALVARKFTVKARHDKTQATSRRLRVEEVTG